MSKIGSAENNIQIKTVTTEWQLGDPIDPKSYGATIDYSKQYYVTLTIDRLVLDVNADSIREINLIG